MVIVAADSYLFPVVECGVRTEEGCMCVDLFSVICMKEIRVKEEASVRGRRSL